MVRRLVDPDLLHQTVEEVSLSRKRAAGDRLLALIQGICEYLGVNRQGLVA
jgi:hypothetical protein